MRATNRRELGVLRELAAWREEEARRRDRPRQRIVPDRVLLEIGRRSPRSVADLDGTRGLHPREQKRSGAAIIDAVEKGVSAPQESLPRPRKRWRGTKDPEVGVAAALADTYLKTRAAELDLSPQLFANRKDLEAVVRILVERGDGVGTDDAGLVDPGEPDSDTPIRLLTGWRREVLGDDVLRMLRGRIGLRVRVRKGGVDLVVEDQEGPSPHRD